MYLNAGTPLLAVAHPPSATFAAANSADERYACTAATSGFDENAPMNSPPVTIGVLTFGFVPGR